MNLGTLMVYVKANIASLTSNLNRAAVHIKTFSAKLQSQFQANAHMMQRFGRRMALVGAVVTAANIGMVKSFATFDKSMRESTAVSEVTTQQYDAMSKMAEDVATKLNIAASKSAKAFYFLGSAGLEATQQMQAFNPVATLAKAAVIGMGEAAEMVVDTMKGLEIEFKNTTHVTDVLAKAVVNSNQTFSQLGQALGYVAGVANKTNNTLEETTTFLSAMADVGIKGTKAGMMLRRAFLNLAAPVSEARDLLYEYNVQVYDNEGRMRSFIELVGELGEKLENVSEEQQNLAFRTLFGVRAIGGQIAIFKKGYKELKKFSDGLEDAGGTAQEIADKQMAAFSNQVGLLGKEIMKLFRSIGESLVPAIESLVNIIKPVIQGMTRWIREHKALTSAIVTTIASFGVFLTVGGLVIATLAGLAIAATALNVTLAAMVVKVALVTGGLSLLLGGIALLVYKLTQSKNEMKDFTERMRESEERLKSSVGWWKKYAETLKETERGLLLLEKHDQRINQLMQDRLRLTMAMSAKAETGFFEKYPPELLETAKEFLKTRVHMTEEQVKLLEAQGGTNNLVKEYIKWLEYVIQLEETNIELQGKRAQKFVESKEKEIEITQKKYEEEKRIADEIALIEDELIALKEGNRLSELNQLDRWYEKAKVQFKNYQEELLIIEEFYHEKRKSLTESGFDMYLRKYQDWTETMRGMTFNLATSMENAFANSFKAITKGTESFSDVMKNLITRLHDILLDMFTQIIARMMMMKMIGAFPGFGAFLGFGMPMTTTPIPYQGTMPPTMYTQQGGFVPKGTDTIPAMLSPEEMVLDKPTTRELMKSIRENANRPVSSPTIIVKAIDSQDVYRFFTENRDMMSSMMIEGAEENHPFRRFNE